ncbi:MAG TPA: 4a-hydroxytetrahydrobiopterin dehydratase [Methylomirabilota bacterium]|jgi:4a-hydroxytetrahydrobiopterin dehydratase
MSGESALDAKTVGERLRALPGWTRSGDAITRTYTFADFKTAMIFVNGVAALAERAEHHPDITVRYKVVTLSLWTHSAGGITGKDIDLARAIDETFPAPAR